MADQFDNGPLEDFKNSLKDISNLMRNLGATSEEFGYITDQFNNAKTALDKYKAGLNPAISAQQKQLKSIDILEKKFSAVNKQIEENGKKSKQTSGEMKTLKSSMQSVIRSIQEEGDAWTERNKKAEEAAKVTAEMKKSSSQLVTANKIAGGSFKDLAEAIKKHTDETGKVHGKSLLAAGGAVMMAKAVGGLANSLRGAIKDLNQYQINLEATSQVSLVSPNGTAGLNSLRKTIGTTRKEFDSFLPTLESVGKVGIDTKSLESAARSVVALYGEGAPAQKALGDYANLIKSMPSLAQDLKFDADLDDRAAGLFALAKQGKVDVAIKAGFLGGIEEGGEAAAIQTDIQKSIRVQEDIDKKVADVLSKTSGALPLLSEIGKYGQISSGLLGIIAATQGAGALKDLGKGFMKGNSKLISTLGKRGSTAFQGARKGGAGLLKATKAGFKGISRGLTQAVGSGSGAASSAVASSAGTGGVGAAATGSGAAGSGAAGAGAVGAGAIAASVAGIAAFGYFMYDAVDSWGSVNQTLMDSNDSLQKMNFAIGSSADAISKITGASQTFTLAGKSAQSLEFGLSDAAVNLGGNFVDAVSETSGSILGLAASGAAAGAIFGPIGIAVGGAVGAIAGLTMAFMHAQDIAEMQQAAQDRLSAESKQMAKELGYASASADAYVEGLKKVQETSDLFREELENARQGAKMFERTIQATDAAANSSVNALFQLRAESAKLRSDLMASLGASGEDFYKTTQEIRAAASQNLTKRFGDINRVLSKTIPQLSKFNPALIGMAMENAEQQRAKVMANFVSETEQTIARLSKSPDILENGLRSELAGIGQDIAKMFGSGLSNAGLEKTYQKKIAFLTASLDAAGKAAREKAKTAFAALGKIAVENAKNRQARADIKITSEDEERLGMKGGGESSVLEKKDSELLKTIKGGGDVDSKAAEKLKKALKDTAGKEAEKGKNLAAAAAAIQKLNQTVSSLDTTETRSERDKIKKIELKQSVVLAEKEQERAKEVSGNYVFDTDRENDAENARTKAINDATKEYEKIARREAEAAGLRGKAADEWVKKQVEAAKTEYNLVSDIKGSELAQQEYDDLEAQKKGVAKQADEFNSVFDAIKNMDPSQLEGSSDNAKEMVEGVKKALESVGKDATVFQKSDAIRKFLKGFGGNVSETLSEISTSVLDSSKESEKASAAAAKGASLASSAAQKQEGTNKFILEKIKEAYELITKHTKEAVAEFDNYLQSEDMELAKARAIAGQFGVLEGAGDLGLPYQEMANSLQADMEVYNAAVKRAENIAKNAPDMAKTLAEKTAKAIGQLGDLTQVKGKFKDIKDPEERKEKERGEYKKTFKKMLKGDQELEGLGEKAIDDLASEMSKKFQEFGPESLSSANLSEMLGIKAETAQIKIQGEAFGAALAKMRKGFSATGISKATAEITASVSSMIDLAEAGGIDAQKQAEMGISFIEKRAEAEAKAQQDIINFSQKFYDEQKKKLDEAMSAPAGERDEKKINTLKRNVIRAEGALVVERNKGAAIQKKKAQESVGLIIKASQLDMRRAQAAQQISETQLDLLEQVGAPFSMILEKQVEIIAAAKQQADIENERLREMEAKGITGVQLEEQRVKAMKASAEVTKKSIQAQRSAMEKLLGAAIGELGNIGGFKRNLLAQQRGTGLVIGPGGIVQGGAGEAKSKSDQAAILQAGAMVEGATQKGMKPSKDAKEASDKVAKTNDALVEENKQLNKNLSELNKNGIKLILEVV
jgi:hypothetical protein